MSEKDADELNVWFFRGTGLSKSHHSCEEIKKRNSGLYRALVILWLIAGFRNGTCWLTALCLSFLTSKKDYMDSKRRGKGKAMHTTVILGNLPYTILFPKWKNEFLQEFQRTDIGLSRITSWKCLYCAINYREKLLKCEDKIRLHVYSFFQVGFPAYLLWMLSFQRWDKISWHCAKLAWV